MQASVLNLNPYIKELSFLFVVVNVNLSQIGNYKHRLAGLDIKF